MTCSCAKTICGSRTSITTKFIPPKRLRWIVAWPRKKPRPRPRQRPTPKRKPKRLRKQKRKLRRLRQLLQPRHLPPIPLHRDRVHHSVFCSAFRDAGEGFCDQPPGSEGGFSRHFSSRFAALDFGSSLDYTYSDSVSIAVWHYHDPRTQRPRADAKSPRSESRR